MKIRLYTFVMRYSLGVAAALCLLGISQLADARMYQWVDPQTGTSYLSGEPPPWYRARQQGPRVLVIEDGKVVDDTEWAASVEREKALREQALIEHQKQQQAEEARRAEAAKLAAEQAREREAEEAAAQPTSREDELQVMRRLVKLYLQQNAAEAAPEAAAE